MNIKCNYTYKSTGGPQGYIFTYSYKSMSIIIFTHININYAIKMKQKCDGLYTFAPLENIDLQ